MRYQELSELSRIEISRIFNIKRVKNLFFMFLLSKNGIGSRPLKHFNRNGIYGHRIYANF